MEITQTQHLKAVQIHGAIHTQGSSPLMVLCEDKKVYFAKTTENTNPPYTELINELLFNHLAAQWHLKVPQCAVISISEELVNAYEGPLPARYAKMDFKNKSFFGVAQVNASIELDTYIRGIKSRSEYNKFENPLEFMKIGDFDYWIANMDRKPDNPNILISHNNDKFFFHPIDHTAALAYYPDYKTLKSAHLHLNRSFSILNSPITKSILKFAPEGAKKLLPSSVESCLYHCEQVIDEIYKEIPSEWGLSKKGKMNLKSVLFNKERLKLVPIFHVNFA